MSSFDLEKFRPYLRILAEIQIKGKLQCKVDASDIVQDTMLKAYAAKQQFHGDNSAQYAGWLRTILANEILQTARQHSRKCRDITREQACSYLQQSSYQLADVLAADVSSPSAGVHRDEQAVMLACMLDRLTEEQRQAIIAKYWHNESLNQIAEAMDRSPQAVAGLIYRGMQELKSIASQEVDESIFLK